jgi:hypothetical protein
MHAAEACFTGRTQSRVPPLGSHQDSATCELDEDDPAVSSTLRHFARPEKEIKWLDVSS